MKKLPANIKKAIRDSAKHYAIARENNQIVREWIDKMLGEEYTGREQTNHDLWLDQLIDGTEISNDPDGLISTFEKFLNGEFDASK